MTAPVVVQGTAVPHPASAKHNNYDTPPVSSHHHNNNNMNHPPPPEQQEQLSQKSNCNDPIFALLLYANVGAIVAVAIIYGAEALTTPTSDINWEPYLIYAAAIAAISIVMSGICLSVLMCIPETLIKVSLIFVTALSLAWAILSFLNGAIVAGVIGIIFFAISVCYAYCVWSRIPFATINLVTAITAIKANLGVTVYAYFLTLVAGAWSFCWSLAVIGLLDRTYVCDAQNVCTDPNYGYLFLLFVAFFFAQQVIQYSIHVIVAGTVGTWWYEPAESGGCCGQAIHNSFIRTMTTSFGSICFGSLIVAILQALRMLANSAQQNGDANFLACIAECILACLAQMVEYLNKWAFVYVGIYGFPYIKSAQSVFELFRNRGWEAIIADDLVANTLLLVSLVGGAVIGAIGIGIQAASNLFTEDDIDQTNVLLYVFILGFFIGLVITSILMSVIGSAVNTVIVCFAEAPGEFQVNHPDLSRQMRDVWSTIFPGSV